MYADFERGRNGVNTERVLCLPGQVLGRWQKNFSFLYTAALGIGWLASIGRKIKGATRKVSEVSETLLRKTRKKAG